MVVTPLKIAFEKPRTLPPGCERNHSNRPSARHLRPTIEVRSVIAFGASVTSPSSFERPYRSRASGMESSI